MNLNSSIVWYIGVLYRVQEPYRLWWRSKVIIKANWCQVVKILCTRYLNKGSFDKFYISCVDLPHWVQDSYQLWCKVIWDQPESTFLETIRPIYATESGGLWDNGITKFQNLPFSGVDVRTREKRNSCRPRLEWCRPAFWVCAFHHVASCFKLLPYFIFKKMIAYCSSASDTWK